MDKNYLAAAGFYYTKWSDVVRCAFCNVELGQWQGDDPFKDHQRWSPSFGLIKGLFVGNTHTGYTDQPETIHQQSARSYDVCGSRHSKYTCWHLFFCCVCVFYNPALIFNVLLQIQIQNI